MHIDVFDEILIDIESLKQRYKDGQSPKIIARELLDVASNLDGLISSLEDKIEA